MAVHDSIIVIGGGHERGRIAHARLDVVERRVSEEIGKLRRIRGRAVLRRPQCAAGKFVVPQHVHHAHRRQRDRE